MELKLMNATLSELMAHGRNQTDDLTFYKLIFQALEQIAWKNATSSEVYLTSFTALTAGFLASLRPELLPQAVAAKNLLFQNHRF